MNKKEKDNQVADVLSYKALVLAISMPDDPLGSEVKEGLAQDEYSGRMVTLLGKENLFEREKNIVTNYALDQGTLYYKLRLCIPNINEIKANILWEEHNSPMARHYGYIKTLNAMQKSYFWLGVKRSGSGSAWTLLPAYLLFRGAMTQSW